MYPARAENIAARDAADFRPLNPISILFIRLTLPFLSRWWLERLHETLKADKDATRTKMPISAGVEFNPARSIIAFDCEPPPSVPQISAGVWQVRRNPYPQARVRRMSKMAALIQ